jgi:hypothetical protein
VTNASKLSAITAAELKIPSLPAPLAAFTCP